MDRRTRRQPFRGEPDRDGRGHRRCGWHHDLRGGRPRPAGRSTRLIEEVTTRLGSDRLLVSNAAVTWLEPVETIDVRHYELMFEVQVRAPFDLARSVLPGMRERGRGWILNISSGAARHPQGPPYTRPAAARCTGCARPRSNGSRPASPRRCTTRVSRSTSCRPRVSSRRRAWSTIGSSGPGWRPSSRPPEVMAEAALALCTGEPGVLTGRVAYGRPLLDELRNCGPDLTSATCR